MIPLLVAGLVATAQPFVLAVGVNNAARPDLPPLKYADDDAAAAAELFGADPSRTFLLTTLDGESQERFSSLRSIARPATRSQLKRVAENLGQLVDRASRDGEQPVVIVWLVGHGAFSSTGEPFVALEDGELTPAMLRADVLGKLEAAHRVHVVMDACHSGAMVQWRAAVKDVSVEEVNRQSFLSSAGKPGHVGVITAAAASQKTFEWEEIRSGIFSALTRAALRGAANADGDQCVSYDEVAAYVSSALQGIAVPEARPQVVAKPPAVDHGAPLSCDGWFVPHASFSSGTRDLGAFHVEDSRGVWLAGGRFEAGHVPDLWLPNDAHLTMKTGQGEFPLTLAQNARVEMPEQPVVVRTQTRGAVERAIEEGLFKVPYGPSFLNGYVASRAGDTRAEKDAPERKDTREGRRAPWILLVAAAPALVSLAAVTTGMVAAALGSWQLVTYLQTDWQRQAREARNWSLVGFGAASVSIAAAVICLAIAGVLAGAWWAWS